MNYLEFFSLKHEPFSNAPVARFYYDSEQHGRALFKLHHAVESMKGLAVLIGEIGAGKSTLARRLLESLPEKQFEASLLMVVHAETTASWLLSRIALLLGVKAAAEDKLKLLSQVYQRLVAIHESGKKAVILIDEAQMLRTREIMEELRGLLNLELSERKLLTFVFFGLTDLDRNLTLDEPLRQRVAMRVRLEPLSRSSAAAYIAHRLRLAGASRMLFTEGAIDLIHRFGRGTPRLINTLCDNALLEAYLSRRPAADEELVLRAADDLGLVGAGPSDADRLRAAGEGLRPAGEPPPPPEGTALSPLEPRPEMTPLPVPDPPPPASGWRLPERGATVGAAGRPIDPRPPEVRAADVPRDHGGSGEDRLEDIDSILDQLEERAKGTS